MGSSGKVVNLVVGKEVTTISGQFQKAYIGTPTAKLSLTLEEGSKLSSVGENAFKDNTFFVSINLSNSAQDMTFGASAFDNVTNLESFSTGSGVLTIGSNALINLKSCKEFNLNAVSTNFNTGVEFILNNPLSAVYFQGITGTVSRVSPSITFDTVTAWTSAYDNGSYYVSYVNGSGGQIINGTMSATTAPITTITTPTYDLVYTHPLTNLGANKGCAVYIGPEVSVIPENLFSAGILTRITSTTPDQKITNQSTLNAFNYSTTVYSSRYTYITSTRATNGTSAIRHPAATGNDTNAQVTASSQTRDFFQTSGIKVSTVSTMHDSKLNTIGKNAFGAEERTASISLDVTKSVVKTSGTPTSYPTNFYVLYLGSGGYYSGSNLTPSAVNVDLSLSGATTGPDVYATSVNIKEAASTRSNTALASVLETVQSHVVDVNIFRVGNNCTIDNSAFAYNAGQTDIRLGSGVQTINDAAFFRVADNSTAYIYGKESNTFKPDSNNGLTSGGHSDIETITYLPDAKDLGRYIAHYQIGASVTAYLFEQIDGTYVINLVGTGATYDTYTESNLPGWHATYGTKVSKVIVDDTVTGVGPYLFYGHTALTSVQFGTGLTSIGAHAFGNCTGLDSFTVPATLTSVGERILEGAAVKTVYYNANTEDAYHSMSGCDANEIILGANVTKIGDGTLGDISTFFVEAGIASEIQKRPSHSAKTDPTWKNRILNSKSV